MDVFIHRAQQQLQLHQLKAQDELFLEIGVEHEEFLRKVEELKLESTAEYKTIAEESRERMRAIIMQSASVSAQEKSKKED